MNPLILALLLLSQQKSEKRSLCPNVPCKIPPCKPVRIPYYSTAMENDPIFTHYGREKNRIPKYYIRVFEKSDPTVPIQSGTLIIRNVPIQ